MTSRTHSEQININVRTSGAKDAASQINDVARAVYQAKVLLGQPIRANLNFRELSEGARRAKGDFAALAQTVRIFRTLVIATGLSQMVRELVQTTDKLTQLESKVRVTAKANEDLNFTMSRLTHIANQTRTGLEAVVTVYSRTARSVEDLGVSQSSTLQFTKTLTQAVAVGGSTSVEASQAMIQLSQGLASGTLKGDELRSVLEQLPVVSKLIAEHMGVAVGELRKLGSEGKISAEEVFAAIIDGSDQMNAKFALLTPTFEQAWEVFNNKLLVAMKMFQPLVSAMAESLGYVTEKWETFGFTMEEIFKTWIRHRDEGFFSQVGALFTDRGGQTNVSFWDMGKQRMEQLRQEQEDEDLIQQGEAMADMYDLMLRPKKAVKKTGREGGLTFAQLVAKMAQEQEVASMTPFESGVTKEFFQKMGQLKASIRESLIAGAGKGGAADEQLRQLQEMIRLEHELAEAQKFVKYWDEEIAKAKEKRMQISIDLAEQEKKLRAENEKRVEEFQRTVQRENNEPPELEAYNREIEKQNQFLGEKSRNGTLRPEDIDKSVRAIEKTTYLYTTAMPMFQQMNDSIADAAANAIIFGDNMHEALSQIARDLASSMLSGLFKTGINAGLNALGLGTAMPGLTGPSPAFVAPPVSAARGGYIPGYEYGGYTGSYARGDIAGVVHGREFVVNANATARNRAMLESMNAGRPVSTPKVTVNNYAGAQVETAMNDDGDLEIRINRAVAAQAPRVIAADMRNPNSRTSKALKNNYELTRRN